MAVCGGSRNGSGTPTSETHPDHQPHPAAAAIRPSSPGWQYSAKFTQLSCSAMDMLLGLWAHFSKGAGYAVNDCMWGTFLNKSNCVTLYLSIIIPHIFPLGTSVIETSLLCMLHAELSLQYLAPLLISMQCLLCSHSGSLYSGKNKPPCLELTIFNGVLRVWYQFCGRWSFVLIVPSAAYNTLFYT